MTLVDIKQVKSNRTKLIDFISDEDCDCSISWHYSVNACEQHRFIQTLTEKSFAIQNMRGQGYYTTAKDDNGSEKNYFIIVLINVLVWYCC